MTTSEDEIVTFLDEVAANKILQACGRSNNARRLCVSWLNMEGTTACFGGNRGGIPGRSQSSAIQRAYQAVFDAGFRIGFMPKYYRRGNTLRATRIRVITRP